MKQNTYENLDQYLGKQDLANIFNVYTDDKLGSFYVTYNINRTVNIINKDKMSLNMYVEHYVQDNETTISISYKIYGTTRLWWLVAKMNDLHDPSASLTVGSKLKLLKADYVSEILKNLEQL